jgi:Flp pilus assembly protein TadG
MLSALLFPVLLGATGLGVEVSEWSVRQVELQRAADEAALAAGLAYSASNNSQTAATAGANVAELNGIAGSPTRNWSPSALLLTDSGISVQQVAGIRNASDVAYQVVIQQSVPLIIAKLFLNASTVPITASAWAEVIPTPAGQPCLVALGTSSSAISMSGNGDIDATGCAVRSNGGIVLSGNASIDASSVYAGGSIATSSNASVTGTQHPNDGTIADPYANYPPIQTEFAALSAGSSGQAIDNSITLNPGTYSSIDLSSKSQVTLNPGLYVVNGDINLSGNSSVTGSGVTIVSSGSFTISGNGTVNLTAPGTSPSGGAISGIVYAGTSSGAMSLSGNGSITFDGVIYFPNGQASLSGNGATSTGSSGCFELIAQTETLSGNGGFSGNCSSLGAKSFSPVNTGTVALVQ